MATNTFLEGCMVAKPGVYYISIPTYFRSEKAILKESKTIV